MGRFPDGEIDLKVNEDVRGADVFLVQPTCPPVNENLTELLIFIDCLKKSIGCAHHGSITVLWVCKKRQKRRGTSSYNGKISCEHYN